MQIVVYILRENSFVEQSLIYRCKLHAEHLERALQPLLRLNPARYTPREKKREREERKSRRVESKSRVPTINHRRRQAPNNQARSFSMHQVYPSDQQSSKVTDSCGCEIEAGWFERLPDTPQTQFITAPRRPDGVYRPADLKRR